MSQVTYPFDPTGQAPGNRVTDEMHTLTAINAKPYRILIPDFAPFYLSNLVVEHVAIDGQVTLLHEGVDYYTTLPYIAAQRSSGKAVYGGLPIISNLVNGGIRLSYQTVGGDFCADVAYVYARLLEQVYNPRTTWWDMISNVQATFPPIEHDTSLDDVQQITVLFEQLEKIRLAILQAPTNVPGQYIAHLLERNPHGLTAEDLGITPVAMLDQATDEEVIRAEPKDKAITLRQLVLFLKSKRLI